MMILMDVAERSYQVYCNSSTHRITCEQEDSCVDIVMMDKETVIISFRGTDSLRDILTDMSRRMVPWMFQKGVYIHRGFYQHYMSLRTNLFTYLATLPGHRVLLTGHSLGGALATICALDLALLLPDIQISAYTFNSPRVGNRQFATMLDAFQNCSVCRVVYTHDLIHRLPYVGYQHTKRRIVISPTICRIHRMIRNHSLIHLRNEAFHGQPTLLA